MNKKYRLTIWPALSVLLLFLSQAAFAIDLTPSVNYFSFDYSATATPTDIDSIVAGRYDALVSDNSFGYGYVEKYNDYIQYKPDLRIYVYFNFNNPQSSSAGLGLLNEFVGPRMAGDGQDSTSIYWHSLDSTRTNWGYYMPYNLSERESRLSTYGSQRRPLINNTNLNFIHHFTDYADSIKNKHYGLRNFNITGLWFDNMTVPQPLDVIDCGGGSPGRHMYESTLGNDLYGCEQTSNWQRALRDTVLIKYTTIVADSLRDRLNIRVNMNAMGWGNGLFEDNSYGYSAEYLDGPLVSPANRTYEFGGNVYVYAQAFHPGPLNSANSIDTDVVAASYSPKSIYQAMVSCSENDVENWFNPSDGSAPYGFKKRWYDFLALYYLWRSRTTYVSFANYPSTLRAANGLDWSPPHAGMPGDSAYWIDALGVRLGRDGYSYAWDTDTVYFYAASVQCDDCLLTSGLGRDDANQNYVVFMKRWTGNDGYRYMVLSRPQARFQTNFTNSSAPGFTLLEGPWQKLDYNGNWSSSISTDSLRNGEGGIYRKYIGGSDNDPPGDVGDLEAQPGGNDGEVMLSWTAPGDDGNVGTASYYVIKYSVDPINVSNWPSAITVPNPPTPLPAGNPQEFTVSGLAAGGLYYFGLRTYDEFDNESGISNIDTTHAAGIGVPVQLETAIDTTGSAVTVVCGMVESYTSVIYEFALDTLPTFPAPLLGVGLLADTTASTEFRDLQRNLYYYWRCRAMASNQSDSSDWSPYIQFNLVTGVAENINDSDCLFPYQGATVSEATPVFSVQYISGSANIFIQVDDSPGFPSPIESGPVPVIQNEITNWQIPVPLEQGKTYYWRASTDNSLWTSPIGFTVGLDIYPYPNPYRSSAGHTGITFANLPQQSEITILTVSGNVVTRKKGLGPGDWVWNVKNDNGKDLASGVYLYLIESPTIKAQNKLMVIR